MRLLLPRLVYWPLLSLLALSCRPEPPARDQPIDIIKEPAIVAVARSQIGVLEDPIGSNRGKKVDEYNATCTDPGAPWCASFTRWCFWKTGQRDVPGAYSPDWYSKSRLIKKEDVRVGDTALIYFNSLGRYGHTICCVEKVSKTLRSIEVTTIEGNTNPDGGREGYGVFRRVRSADTLTFVRWN